MGRFGQDGKVERGVGHSRAPISFLYYKSGSDGTLETVRAKVRAKVRPGEFDAWLKSRFLFVRDPVTGKPLKTDSNPEEKTDSKPEQKTDSKPAKPNSKPRNGSPVVGSLAGLREALDEECKEDPHEIYGEF